MMNESPKNTSVIYKYPPWYSGVFRTQVTLKMAFKLLSRRAIKKELK